MSSHAVSNIYRTRIDPAKHFFIHCQIDLKTRYLNVTEWESSKFHAAFAHAKLRCWWAFIKYTQSRWSSHALSNIYRTRIDSAKHFSIFVKSIWKPDVSECDCMRFLKISCCFCTCKIEMLMSIHEVHPVKIVIPRSFKHPKNTTWSCETLFYFCQINLKTRYLKMTEWEFSKFHAAFAHAKLRCWWAFIKYTQSR